ncbi:MAG TPA: hypothetical protein PKE07_14450, partial [Lacibacter sp.]|nr:hypothetical protein [Lacibacter sp.]
MSAAVHTLSLIIFALLMFNLIFNLTILIVLFQKKFSFRKELEKINEEYNKTILNSQIEIQEETFQNISREVHDNIGQRLSLAKLIFIENNINVLKTNKSVAEEIIEESISDLKNLSRSLTANLIKEEGLKNAIEKEIDRLIRLANININFSCKGEDYYMSSEKELLLFRIIQEALQNIIRHSASKKAEIYLNYTKEFIELRISDNGRGFFIENKKNDSHRFSSGLSNMKNRATALNGSFH